MFQKEVGCGSKSCGPTSQPKKAGHIQGRRVGQPVCDPEGDPGGVCGYECVRETRRGLQSLFRKEGFPQAMLEGSILDL